MRKRRIVFVLIAALAVSSCRITRPDQENYMFDGGKVPVEEFVDALKSNFHASVSRDDFKTPDDEPMRSYDIDGELADITVISIGDFRCDLSADFHTTFNQKLYWGDLVFNSQNPSEREAAKKMLVRSAQQVGGGLQELYEC